MRKDMVDQKEGIGTLKVKVHMDDMKRVTVKDQDYFYQNISNTPFTLGIVLPNRYGKFRLELESKKFLEWKGQLIVNSDLPKKLQQNNISLQ